MEQNVHAVLFEQPKKKKKKKKKKKNEKGSKLENLK